MTVVTRFAPSPTGYLHIGGARTALFNWLFARHMGGKFLLRIEDTDRTRSTEDAIAKIFDGMKWLGLDWDGDVLFQFVRADRHAAVAREMLASGHAYYCYCSPQDLEEMRNLARAEGRPIRYDGRWRDRDPKDAPPGIPPVIRFKAPQQGATVIKDHVQGEVTVQNEQLDDLIILRADGTPTYNLSVVVDDHDMGITHIIRGDDHLTNAFRQTQLYRAMGWTLPDFAHIPLIHGPDGAKLSKRHGALGVDAYRDMGYLPEAMRNYLLRLGWGHGDDEIISTAQAIEWFTLDHVGKSPSRFDFAKLGNLNGHYMRASTDKDLADAVSPFLATLVERALTEQDHQKLVKAMPSMKERAKSLIELAQTALYLLAKRPLQLDEGARKQINAEGRALLAKTESALCAVTLWSAATTESAIRQLAEQEGLKLGLIAQPLRAALTGRTVSPPVFDVLDNLGREESLGRITDALQGS